MQNYFISSEITSGNIQMRNDKIFMIKSENFVWRKGINHRYTLKVTRMRRSSEIPFILLWYKNKNRHLKKNV